MIDLEKVCFAYESEIALRYIGNSAIPYGKPPSRKAGQYRRGRLSAGSEFAERNNGEWRSIDGRDKKEAGGWRRYLICREEIPV